MLAAVLEELRRRDHRLPQLGIELGGQPSLIHPGLALEVDAQLLAQRWCLARGMWAFETFNCGESVAEQRCSVDLHLCHDPIRSSASLADPLTRGAQPLSRALPVGGIG